MIDKIDHIGIAVDSLDDTLEKYNKLGLTHKNIESVPEQKVRVGFIPIGESNIELVEATSQDSPIAKFIERFGPGIHHIALEVTDIDAKLQELKERDVHLIDETPRSGAHNTKVAFIHPKSMNGVLIELVQKQ